MLGGADPLRGQAVEALRPSPHEHRVRLALSGMIAEILRCMAELRTVEPGLFLLHGGLPSHVDAEGSDAKVPPRLPTSQE